MRRMRDRSTSDWREGISANGSSIPFVPAARTLPKGLLAFLLTFVVLADFSAATLTLDDRTPSRPVQLSSDVLPPTSALWSSPLGTGTSFSLSGNLSDLVVDPIRPRAYAADRLNDRVYALDLNNGSLLASIPVRAGPTALAIAPAGNTLYVGHGANRSIIEVDLNSLAVVRTFETTFLTWRIVAPDDMTLVATTHDDQWSGEYPYVLNASTGAVFQRLCWSQLACNKFYQDTLVAASSDGSRLFLADSLVYPTALYSYERNVGGNVSGWSYAGDNRGPGWGLSGGATDLAVSPDNLYLYLTSAQTSLLKLRTSDFTLVKSFGAFRRSSALVVSPSGDRVAMSPGDASIHVFDEFGKPLWRIGMTAPVTRLRITARGDRFVAVAGASTVEVVSAYLPTPPFQLTEIARAWLLYSALMATGVEGLVLAVLVIGQLRHRR